MANPIPDPSIPPPPAPPNTSTPAWWQDYSYSGAYDPNAELAMTVNTLLPNLSPIDRSYWSSWLYQQNPTQFAAYEPGKITDFGSEGDVSQRGAFTSADRAAQAETALLNKVTNNGATKVADQGPAVPWLQRVMDTLKSYAPTEADQGPAAGQPGASTGADRRTRAQERGLQSDLTRLFGEAQASPDLQPYLELARQFVAPTFTNAPISTPTPSGIRADAFQQPTASLSRMNFVSNPKFL